MAAALQTDRPVIPLYIWDDVEAALLGAAARWRLEAGLKALAAQLGEIGARLILRRGPALDVLRALISETGASSVYWSRYYEASAIERDKSVKAALSAAGVEARSFEGFLLREPFQTTTKEGGFYKVYSPFQRAFAGGFAPDEALLAPSRWPAPETWPESTALESLALGHAMNRGAAVLARWMKAGEVAAEARLQGFVESGLAQYHQRRDRMDQDGTSGLSPHLALGEISPQRAWRAAALAAEASPEVRNGAEVFLKELVWREFAWHLAYHTPQIRHANWRKEWDAFPWRDAASAGDAWTAWRQGRTGLPLVDAAMRELYTTGLMHNRARMIAGSYLTKNLMIDWRLGERWFADCLIDFDPASNAMGWQWVAGSGPDAAPFFRIFNPETQATKFDPDGRYRARWLPEWRASATGLLGAEAPDDGRGEDGMAFFDACPRSWRLSPDDPYPEPSLSLKAGRERALDAYQTLRTA